MTPPGLGVGAGGIGEGVLGIDENCLKKTPERKKKPVDRGGHSEAMLSIGYSRGGS